jgi:hypothetical protein
VRGKSSELIVVKQEKILFVSLEPGGFSSFAMGRLSRGEYIMQADFVSFLPSQVA